MSNRNQFQGVYAVMPTPLQEDESLDHAGLRHLVNFYVDTGCHGLVILGSGGEFPYFASEERLQIIKTTAAEVKNRIPVVVGVGFHSLRESVEFIKTAGEENIDGFLVVLPTYYPLLFDDVLSFYKHICAISKKPVFYYHYPQMTGHFFSTEQLTQLFSLKNMAGVKESSLSLIDIRRHLEATRDKDFSLFSGNSLSLLTVLSMGGSGTICQIPSFAPGLVVDCYKAWMSGNKELAESLQSNILSLLPFLNTFTLSEVVQKFAYTAFSRLPLTLKNRNRSRHAVIKETLRQLGHPISARVRSPLPQLNDFDREAIRNILSKVKLA
jgi:dihydrodipicolinate synthase/N-acetylneuraminate lyase